MTDGEHMYVYMYVPSYTLAALGRGALGMMQSLQDRGLFLCLAGDDGLPGTAGVWDITCYMCECCDKAHSEAAVLVQ